MKNRKYEVKLENEGDNITAYEDGSLLQTLQPTKKTIHAVELDNDDDDVTVGDDHYEHYETSDDDVVN